MAITTYDNDLIAIAYHGATHATIAHAFGFKITQVSIKQGETFCDIDSGHDKSESAIRRRIKFNLAPWLEANNSIEGCESDFAQAKELLAMFDPAIRYQVFRECVREIIRCCAIRLSQNRSACWQAHCSKGKRFPDPKSAPS